VENRKNRRIFALDTAAPAVDDAMNVSRLDPCSEPFEVVFGIELAHALHGQSRFVLVAGLGERQQFLGPFEESFLFLGQDPPPPIWNVLRQNTGSGGGPAGNAQRAAGLLKRRTVRPLVTVPATQALVG